MQIKIYQIDMERDVNNVCFMSHNRLQKFQGSTDIDSKIYDLVYEKAILCNSLEDIFRILNIEHPKDYKGRSLSVSDIVEVIDSKIIENGFYFCDSVGFKKVVFHPEECGISERYNKKDTYKSIDDKIHNSKVQIPHKHLSVYEKQSKSDLDR